jgi:fatty acid/phospholipid biosynthesis enzyme
MTAVKNSKNTSMWNCIQHQLEGKSDISLSAGNTGFSSYFKNDFKNDE